MVKNEKYLRHSISHVLQYFTIFTNIRNNFKYFTLLHSNISRNIWCKYLWWYFTIFHIIFLVSFPVNISCYVSWYIVLCFTMFYVMFTIQFNFFEIFCVVFPHIFHNICQYCFKCPLCWTVSVSLLPQPEGALQNSNCAGLLAALLAMPAPASSSARSLLSDHSAQRMVRRFPTRSWIFDHCASTSVLCGHFQQKVLCFAGTFLLICLRQEEMTSDRWLVRRWYIETRKFCLWTPLQNFENRYFSDST